MSAPPSSVEPPLMSLSGWVKKKGTRQGLWHKRFLSISGLQLTISKDELNQVIEQRIDLSITYSATLIEGSSPPRFQIDFPGIEPLLFTTDAPEDALRWVTAFHTLSSVASHPALSMSDFRIISVIGRGFYGKVMLCQKVDSRELYAIKSIQKKRLSETRNFHTVISERNILMKAHHPFIVNLCFAFQTPSKFYLGLEYAPGGELFFHMDKRGVIRIDDARLYTAEIGLALSYLHSIGVIYRDLKPENVLFDGSGHIKLTDFGLSKLVDHTQTTSTFCGTTEYLAPELVMKRPYSYAVDIWQLGILTYEMLLGATPFCHDNRAKIFSAILSSEPAFPSRLDWRVKDFISRLLTKDPAERPRFDDLKSHPFFEGFDWEKVIKRQYRPHFIPPIVDPLNPSNFDPAFTREVAADSLGPPGSEEFGKVPGFSYSEEMMGEPE